MYEGMRIVLVEWTTSMDHHGREYKSKKPANAGLSGIGGVDGTRTRDPRRDRPVF
jgi:hypothetical protein